MSEVDESKLNLELDDQHIEKFFDMLNRNTVATERGALYGGIALIASVAAIIISIWQR